MIKPNDMKEAVAENAKAVISKIQEAADSTSLLSESQKRNKEFESALLEVGEDPFPSSALPTVMRDLVKTVSTVDRVPESIPACYALGIASACLGRNLELSLGSMQTRGNLFIIQSVPSGAGKSRGARPIYKPFSDHIKRKNEELKPAAKRKRQEISAYKLEIDRLKRSKGPATEKIDKLVSLQEKLDEIEGRQTEHRLVVEDATGASIEPHLATFGETTFFFSSDARGAMENLLGRHNDGRAECALFLKGYSGREPHHCNRITRDNISFEDLCIALCFAVQGDLVGEVLSSDALEQSGFIARCLIASEYVQYNIVPSGLEHDKSVLEAWRLKVESLLDSFRMADCELTCGCRLSEKAKQLDIAFAQDCEAFCNSNRDVASVAARWREQSLRLAVVLHGVIHGVHAGSEEISPETMTSAQSIAKWFAGQYYRLVLQARLEAMKEIFEDLKIRFGPKPDDPTAGADHCAPYQVARTKHAKNIKEAIELMKRLSVNGLGQWDEKPSTGKRAHIGLWFDAE